MTQPPYGPRSGEPTDPQPGEWGQQPPQFGQWGQQPPPQQPGQQPGEWGQQPGQWSQPGYGQPSGQQPEPTQPGYGQPGYGQPGYPPPGGYAQPGPQQPGQWSPPSPMAPPAKPRGRGKLIAGAAAVVVLAGGGVATYVAFSDSGSSSGASSPKQAVQSFVSDLNNSDFLGMLDDLAPGEKRALADPMREEINQLKRLNVLQPSTNPNKISAVQVSATNLTFSDKTVSINDHVQIVQLTGGKVQISADASKIPLTKKFLDAAFPGGSIPSGSVDKQTVDIGQAVKENGEPVHIATEKVDGKWYPSLFYTYANYAAQQSVPSAADRIPNKGAATADAAVGDLITALSKGDYTRAIELASPDELGVLHDYGKLVLRSAGSAGTAPFTVSDIQFTHKDISGGQRLILKSIDVDANGTQVKVSVDNNCYSVAVGGDSQKMCADNLIKLLSQQLGDRGSAMTAAQKDAFTHLINGLSSIGIDVSQTGGQWYVDPVRSYFDIVGSILSGLQGNDVYELIDFFRGLN